MEIKKEAKNPIEQRILEYLQENASEVLAEKINSGSKTLLGAMKYCRDQAKGMQHDQIACVEDQVVFGWVIHFFEEDSIVEDKPRPKVITPAGVKTKPSVPIAPLKKVEPQLDMFSMVGGVQPKPEPVVEPVEEEDQYEATDSEGEEDPF